MSESKPTVAVIGLLPRQAARVEEAYGDQFDLRFIKAETDMAMRRVKATAGSSEHVILMTKFVPHDVCCALKGHEGLEYCNGGIGSVNLKLSEILSR